MASLLLLGLIIPLACNNVTPISTGSGGGRGNQPTPTATNLNGWTSTPTATLQPTPAYVGTVSTGISSPNGLAYANSLIYVAEGDGASVSEVQVLNAGTNAVNSTWTGSGSTLFQWPSGVAAAGTTVYVLDDNATTYNGMVYALAPAAIPTPITNWSTYNGNALLNAGGIATDTHGNVYVASQGAYNYNGYYENGQLYEFGPTGTTIASWSSLSGSEGFNAAPVAVALDSGNNIYVADANNNELWVLSSNGGSFTVTNDWNLPLTYYYDSNCQCSYEVTGYYGLSVDASQNVFVADYYNNQVEVYNQTGTLIGLFDGNQSGATPFSGPDALLLYNSNIYVGNNSGNTLEIFGPDNY